jgi:glycyl-tRNA synthetase beta chain
MKGGLSVSNRQGTSLDKRDAVLEIGTEELPARLFPELINIMAESADRLLQEERVEYSSVRAYATPRRLVLYIKEVAPFGRPLVREVRGPTYGVAFDSVGEPTRAAIGFAHAQGVDVSDLIIKEEAKGKFVYAISRVPGPEAGSALKDVFTRFIRGLSFERAMRWGDGGFRFVRPIRWLLALLGGDIIDIEINDIKGDRSTSGHRFLTSGMIEVPRAEDYFDILEEAYCVVDQDKRRSIVEKGIRELAEGVGGQVAEDERLLTELTYLAEHPAPLAGGFDPDLLTLPKEVIVTSMKVHQRFFPIEDREGALLPVFAAVRDGLDTRIDAVRKGYERVLSARLKDAKFFYEEDTKSQLETYVPGLKGIVFHEGLGTVLEKTCRIVALSEAVADRLGYHDDTRAKVKRAAQLCKADLITNMVREFPELQGVMGREYALLAGENEDTARAIFEHYLPRFRGDVLPESPAGVILALVDKIDTVAGFFGIGIIPSGSEDPYALRRSISGIVSILHEREVHLPVSWLATKAVSLLETQGALTRSSKETVDDILDGLGQRARSSLIDRGIRYDLVDAAMAIGFDDVPDTHKRAEALQEASVTKEFVLACTGYTRASRLAGSIDHGAVDPSLLSEPAEKTLFDALCMAEESIRIMLREKDYSGILKALSELAEPIDVFFEDVLVMAEDENVRRNRLALLARIPSLVRAVADLGKVVEKAV